MSAAKYLLQRPKAERHVGSSILFCSPGVSQPDTAMLNKRFAAMSGDVKWFCADQPAGFTSGHHGWHDVAKRDLFRKDIVRAGRSDMHLPPTFRLKDCVTDHILVAVKALAAKERP